MTDNLDPFALARAADSDNRARLRAAAEELAALYRAPLPPGDAGLVAAVERWRQLQPRHHFEKLLGFRYTCDDEAEIINPLSTRAAVEFEKWIEQTPAQGLPGVVAKLRYLLEQDPGHGLEDIEGEQLIAVIEREAGRAAQ